MANGKIGCNKGKTYLVDPNNFDGNNSSSNIFVPLEDLNISIQLKTTKRGRTILSANNSIRTAESSNTLKVNFIEGSDVNGKKVLTSKFTDLTTVFDDSESENLGITNIDIDFNSQQTPMITINFIDVRGSAIFQNEDKIITTENKYSIFFQLPYPLYELTIKGYYGQAVTYCLHMLKFNSKFNPTTGNFEITAQFIGSTYAMLSDMLIGFLKAIPYTEIGSNIYKEINEKRGSLPPIPNLNELMVSISNINENIEKVNKDDLSASIIGTSDSKHDILKIIKNEIKALGDVISFDKKIKTDNNEYKYIFVNPDDKNIEGNITGYNDNVTKQITAFNTNNDIKLTNDILISINKNLAIGITAKELDINQTLSDDELGEFAIKFNIPKNEALEKRNDVIKNLFGQKINGIVNVYDLTNIYTELNKTLNNFNVNIENEKRNLAEDIRQNVASAIGFEPTVRNIVEVFTIAVEVFLKTIFTVSNNAKTNVNRTNELKSRFNNTQSSNNNNNDYSSISSDFHPWPEYREKEDKQGYVEKYLGTPDVLNNPFNVNELEFIDDLLKAFLTAALFSKNAENELSNVIKMWAPVNPLDTPLFTTTFPYERLPDGGLTREDVVNLMVIRGMTFLGYTNILNGVSDTDILLMAENEANGVLNHISNDIVKTSFNTIKIDDFITATGTLDGKRVNLLNQNTDAGKLYYSYNYIYPSLDNKVLPVSGNFNISKEKPITNTDIVLTNYNNNVKFPKPIDDGIYLKILSIDEYNGFDVEFESGIDSEIKPIIYNELNKDTVLVDKAGFSVFGGKYGIQEFRDMDYGNSFLSGLPLMFVFYGDFGYQALGKNRANSRHKTTEYDLRENGKIKKGNSILTFRTKRDIFNFIDDEDLMVHDSYGQSMVLFSSLLKNKTYITYPFINYQVRDLPSDDLFSLFGSPWYYGQKTSKYKEYNQALMFLHTIPWRSNSFEHPVIYNLFSLKGGFIHAPKLWCAYIGSILWRYDSTEPTMVDGVITKGGSGKNDPIIWKYDDNFFDSIIDEVTGRDEYMRRLNGKSLFNRNKISNILLGLSDQMKDEFKKAFFDFVNGDFLISWPSLRNSLEIWDGDGISFINEIETIKNSVNNNGRISVESLKNLKNKDNYEVITTNFENLFLELKGDYETSAVVGKPNVVQNIIKAMMEEVVIANTGYAIWGGRKSTKKIILENNSPSVVAPTIGSGRMTIEVPADDSGFEIINTPEDKFRLYFNKVVEIFNGNTTSVSRIEKENQLALFGTSNENLIKLQLYRHCKNVYDKWVGGTDNIENLIFRCNGADDKPLRNSLDSQIALKYGGNNDAKLIDSFRFVTRSFKDIGDKLFINPTPINSFLHDNPNSNVYHAITELLANNNFTFTPLPTFINYKDIKVLESIFEPHTYTKAIENGVCGPSFVCVYVGQSSKNLDMGIKNSDYSSDGFDVRCDKDGNMSIIPDDFTENAEPHEDVVPVFAVNFGQQNQNIFKDVNLDQSEFGETAESLLIVDEITKQGGENNRTLAGQNIYNVYSVRSYKSEIEMMGNAMIQPMMYYQLNNIPMFHGAYMITRVKHNIKPNYMSTNFTGVRIRLPETKIFDASDLYMSLIDSFNLSSSSTEITPQTPRSNNSSPNSRLAKKTIKCGTVTKNVISFENTLNLVVTYLEGAYCKGGTLCGSNNSGETLWGLDRKNHAVTSKTIAFWRNVDAKDKSRWDSVYPKPSDEPTLFREYSSILLEDYENFKKRYLKNSALVNLIESDGRLYFNMVYAVFNGPGFFRGFAKILNEAYNAGTQTADALVKIFVDERVHGAYNAYNKGTGKNLSNASARLIADTGYDIEKLSGLGNFCIKT